MQTLQLVSGLVGIVVGFLAGFASYGSILMETGGRGFVSFLLAVAVGVVAGLLAAYLVRLVGSNLPKA